MRRQAIETITDTTNGYYDHDVRLRLDAAATALQHTRRVSWLHFAWANAIAGWLALAALVVLAHCTGCAPVKHPTAPEFGRSISEQGSAALAIETWCFSGDPSQHDIRITGHAGSAVVIGDHEALTALHVVNCDPGAAPVIVAIDVYSDRHQVAVLARDPAHDVARIAVAGDLALMDAPISVADVRQGQRICQTAAEPTRTRWCGDIVSITIEPVGDAVPERVARHEIHTEHGNSGSGIYDEAGHLVAITTNLRECDGFPCGGIAPLLFGLDIARVP